MKKICLLALFLFVTDIISAQNIHIIFVDSANTSGIENGTLSHPFNTIQEAIDTASSGDTIIVRPGTYQEILTIENKGPLVLSSLYYKSLDEKYTENTIIHAMDLVIKTTTVGIDSITISGFTLICLSDRFDYMFLIQGNNSVTIKDSYIRNSGLLINFGNGIYANNHSVIIENCEFTNNNKNWLINNTSEYMLIRSCTFSHNNGIINCAGSEYKVDIINSLFHHNKNQITIRLAGVSGSIVNSTLADNDAQVLALWGATINIYNTIIWDNRDESYAGYEHFQYSLVNRSDVSGVGVINADPLFVDALNYDYRLRPNSPCINTGTAYSLSINLPSTDIYGGPRIYNNRLDIGASENFSPLPNDTTFCSNEPDNYLTAYGQNLKWYKKDSIDKLIFEGDSLYVDISDSAKTTYYVSQTCNGVESVPQPVTYQVIAPPDKPSIMNKGKTLLICPDSGYYTYNWYFNNNMMSEQHKQFLEIDPDYEGYYHVEVVSENHCKTKSEAYTPPKDLKKSAQTGEDVLIYPNPNKGVFNLIINNDVKGKVDVRIQDYSGKEMKKLELIKDIYSSSVHINVENYPEGLYILEIRYNNDLVTRKIFIIQ